MQCGGDRFKSDTVHKMETTKVALFKGKKIRKTLFQNEWWFSVIDVIEVLTDSNQPSKYWTAMKARVNSDDGLQLSTICRQLKLKSSDGKSMKPIAYCQGLSLT